MALGARHSLGISLGSRALHVAEIRASGEDFSVVRAAELQFGENDSLQDPAALGKKLAHFLKQNGFSSAPVVFGMPAQWLMFKEKTLPPVAPELIPDMLRIQTERDFSLEPSALAIDYCTGTSTLEGQPVMLVATMRERIQQITALAAAAGLAKKLKSITTTTLALVAASQHGTLLYCGANGAELATRGSDGLPRLRHVSSNSAPKNKSGAAVASQLAVELRRAMALGQQNAGIGELAVWNDIESDPALVQELAAELEISVKPAGRLKGVKSDASASRFVGSAALALCAFRPALLGIDMLHSRLEVRVPSRITSKRIWSAVAIVVLLLCFGALVYDWQKSEQEIVDLTQQRDDMKPNFDTAKIFVNRMNTARAWYDRRPNYLECLRAITLSFPEEGRVWTSNLTLREDMRGILSGRAVDEKSVLDVLDKLKSGQTFSDVKMLHMRGSGAKGSEISFAISFAFLVAE